MLFCAFKLPERRQYKTSAIVQHSSNHKLVHLSSSFSLTQFMVATCLKRSFAPRQMFQQQVDVWLSSWLKGVQVSMPNVLKRQKVEVDSVIWDKCCQPLAELSFTFSQLWQPWNTSSGFEFIQLWFLIMVFWWLSWTGFFYILFLLDPCVFGTHGQTKFLLTRLFNNQKYDYVWHAEQLCDVIIWSKCGKKIKVKVADDIACSEVSVYSWQYPRDGLGTHPGGGGSPTRATSAVIGSHCLQT